MKKLFTLVAIGLSAAAFSQPGTIISEQKISNLFGGFTGVLDNSDRFGEACENIGDLDGDGVTDLAVAAVSDDDGASSAGAVYILFMNADGTVSSHQKISATTGGLTGPLSASDRFGSSIAALGDLDGDGVEDIAVGASGDDTGGSSAGALYILFLNTDGTVSSEQKICHGTGGLSADLSVGASQFGVSCAPIGDLDGDTKMDLIVGAFGDDDGGANRGAAYILFLDTDGTVISEQKISSTAGGFTGTLDNSDNFGISVGAIGDLDGDGKEDVVVGAHLDDDGGTSRGAVYVLFLETDGTVLSHQKISDTDGGFTATIEDSDMLGISVDRVGDINQDGNEDIAIGSRGDDDGASAAGASYIVFLNTDGTVFGFQKISSTEGGLTGPLNASDEFGYSVTGLGDMNGDGYDDIAIGCRYDDDGGSARGAVYVLFLDGCNLDADFTASATDVCQNDVVIFTNTSVNTGSFTYEWQIDYAFHSGTTNSSKLFDTGGSFTVTLITEKTNCANDSAEVIINVTPNSTATIDTTVCGDYTVPSGDETYSIAGTYNDTIPNAAGCDSILTINLTISPDDPSFSYDAASYCAAGADPTPTITGTLGGTFTSTLGLIIDGATGEIDLSASTPGSYDVTYTTASPTCSEFSIESVTINASDDPSFDYASATYCSSETDPVANITGTGGGTFSAPAGVSFISASTGEIDLSASTAGTYDIKYVTPGACPDSTTFSITINAATASSFSVTECTSYTVPSGDETYSASTVAMDTIPNAAGCDSVMTITITITGEATSSFDVTECTSYTVPSGDETYTSSTVAMDTIPSAAGCDSVMTITITISGESTSSIDVTECESYTVPSGDETYMMTGTYMDTIPTMMGCDSVITINLTIGGVDTSVTATDTNLTANATGVTYQWIDCSTGTPIAGATDQTFNPSADGDYAVIITDGACVDTSSCYTIFGLGIPDPSTIGFNMYPNPTEGLVYLDFGTSVNATVRLLDISGRLISETTVTETIHKLEVEGEAGMYLIEVIGENGARSIERLIKH